MHEKVKLGLDPPGKIIIDMISQTDIEQGELCGRLLHEPGLGRFHIQSSICLHEAGNAVNSCCFNCIPAVQQSEKKGMQASLFLPPSL